MTSPRGISGLLALTVSAALILGCDARSPLASANGGPLAARAPGTFPPPAPVGFTATFRTDSFTVELSWFHDGTQLASTWSVERRDVSDDLWVEMAAGSGVGGRFLDTGVAMGPARTVNYRVKVCNAAGCGTSPTAPVAVPAFPAPDLAAAAGANRITLTWHHPVESDMVYHVLRRTASTTYSRRVTTAPGARSFVDAKVSQGQTYYYRVRALGPAAASSPRSFRPSAWSQEASATPGGSGAGGPPVARIGSAVGTGKTSAILHGIVTPNGRATAVWFQWGNSSLLTGAPTTPVDTIEAGFAPVAVFAPVTGLVDGIPYYYRVVAENDAGLRSSAVVPLRPGYSTPLQVRATFVRPDHEVDLSWTPASGATYRVERRVPLQSEWTTLATGYTQTSLTDRDVPLDSIYRYEYRVAACNDLDCREAATSVASVPLPVPSAYGAVVGPNQVQLAWNSTGAPANVVYQVRRRTPGSTFGTPVTTAPGVGVFTDRDVIADSTYLYQVRALLPTPGQGNRPSAWSGVLRVTAGAAGATPLVTTGGFQRGVDRMVLTGTVDVRAPGTTAFFIHSRYPDPTLSSTQAVAIPQGASGPTPVSTSISPPTGPLYYRLAARDGAGTVRGAIRAAVYAPATLAAPSGVQAWFDGESYSAEVRWTAVTGAEDYRVSGGNHGTYSSGGSTSFSDHAFSVRSSSVLTYWIQACNALGCGPASRSVRVTTAVLEAPGGVEATVLGNDRVLVRWDDRSIGEGGWSVERCPGRSHVCVGITVPGNGVASYTDTGVTPGYYLYYIRALTIDGRSSSPAKFAGVTVPSQP